MITDACWKCQCDGKRSDLWLKMVPWFSPSYPGVWLSTGTTVEEQGTEEVAGFTSHWH